MRRMRLGFAAAAGVAVIAGVVVYQRSSLSIFRKSLDEKDRQVASRIQEMVESESDEVASTKRKVARRRADSAEVVVKSTGQVCSAAEPVGSGPEGLKFDAELWTRFMSDYHGIKSDLTAWLKANAGSFAADRLEWMEKQIASARVMRPQAQIEPDMTWRGVLSWTRPREGIIAPGERPALIHVSDGFLKLYQSDRVRARFEIARALAYSWSPCEMGATAGAWTGLMQCLGVSEDEQKCAPGAVSESGWATSTAVAKMVAAPGCEVPAFQDAALQACLGSFKSVDRTVASSAAAISSDEENAK